MPHRALVVLAVLAALLGPAHAAPLVQVRSRSHLELTEAHRSGDAFLISGRLLDDATTGGIPEEAVHLTLRPRAMAGERSSLVDLDLPTGEGGGFELRIPSGTLSATPDGVTLELSFAGGRGYLAAPRLVTLVSVARGSLDLALDAPPAIDLSAGALTVTLRASEGGAPRDVEIGLYGDGDQLVGSALTGPRGEATSRVPLAWLGGAGRHTIEARFDGDALDNPCSRTISALAYETTRLTLITKQESVTADQRLAFSGTLLAEDRPAAGATVTLDAEGRPAAATLTDRQGRFSFALAASDFPGGRVDFVARYDPDRESRRGAISTPFYVTILPARPFPVRALVWPLIAILATTALGWLAARRLRGRAAQGSRSLSAPSPPTGLRARSPALMARLRSARDRTIAGTIEDAIFARPVPSACLVLSATSSSRALVADAAGAFVLDDLADGSWIVEVSAPGYQSLRVSVTVPHRGELRGARLLVVPLRALVLEAHEQAIRPLLTERAVAKGTELEEGAYLRLTPREALERALRAQPALAAQLVAFTRLVELAYYSGRPPDQALLVEARRLARQIAESRTVSVL